MTLIVSVISNLGILQASDSNITLTDSAGRDSAGDTDKRKVYELGFCPAALALAGSYEIQHVEMDSWMPDAINDYASRPSPTLEGFARYLGWRLSVDGTPGETKLLIHIAGYVSDSLGSHPEMWFVRNAKGIDGVTGDYTDWSDTFEVTDEFSAGYRDDCAAGHITGHSYDRRYFNGLPAGRINYIRFNQMFRSSFLQRVWAEPRWEFRPPRDLSELALFIELELRVIGTLFAVSDYPAPYVGGEPQVAIIQPPADAVPL